MTATDAAPAPSTHGRALLRCGILAGPLFIGLVQLQAAGRPGFHLMTTPLSLLSLGSAGWIQTLNFILSGVLVIACGVGVRAVLQSRGGTFASIMLILYGVGLAAAGIFPADPIDDFPLGSHQAAAMSWHASLHGMAFALAHIGVFAACIALALQFARRGLKRWAALSIATAIVTPALIALGFANASVIGLAFFLTGVVAMGWLAAASWRLSR